MLRRFGLKAGAATVMDQSAGAFAGDMGLSTRLHADLWGDCRTTPDGQEDGLRDGLEGDSQILDLVTFYAHNLAVPERRAINDPVAWRRGCRPAGCRSRLAQTRPRCADRLSGKSLICAFSPFWLCFLPPPHWLTFPKR